MLNDYQNADRQRPRRAQFSSALQAAGLLALVVIIATHRSLMGNLMDRYPTASLIALWAVAMLSYHQDAKHHCLGWGIWSQIFATACLAAMVVFGFKYGRWLGLLIAPPFLWLQFQFTRRWWARPGAWW